MNKRFVSVCLLMVFGLGLGIASSEVLARMFVPTSDFLWKWDPLIGMKLTPGKRGRAVKPGLYDVAVEVNSAGFRDREHTFEKLPGVRRIALLGDSVVEALQVPFEDSITPLIEHRLQAAGIPSEVINFGVSGTGTAREYLTLRHYALKYKPDLVLLFFSGNDYGDNTRELKGLSYIPYPQSDREGHLVRDQSGHPTFSPFEDEPSPLAFVTDVLRDYSKSYRLIRERIDTLPPFADMFGALGQKKASAATGEPKDSNLGFYEIYRTHAKSQWAKGRLVTEELLVSLRDLAAESGVEFAVVTVPGAWEVYPANWDEVLNQTPGMREAGVDIDLPTRNLSQFLKQNGVQLINLLPDFRERAVTTPSLYLQGDGHWTAVGHRLAAELVSQKVAKLLAPMSGYLTSSNQNR